MIRIGLTGGVASGKSTILKYLQALNIHCIDADKVGHMVYEKDTPSYHKLLSIFGNNILAEDQTIDRKKLGPIVFSDPNEMKKLTDVTWPAMKSLILNEFENHKQDKIVVLEAAVLIEAGFTDVVDKVWVTQVPREVAISRLSERNNYNAEFAEKILSRQLTNEQRATYADVIFDTNGDYQVTKDKVINEVNKLLNQSSDKL
ncbi:hypothetical protein CYY_006437 [Polysphondylium violaceum]|uniref:Dephospho-CoA kinase n=1 Tax=Polysphondylium violaceum TaxID=133409 RepID=A0A8J4PQV7_9MYCE|nr:hypothetical protein CYY_006437 [Polysphondylium violaceum]